MGKPSTTYFCIAGHLLEDNLDGCHGEYDSLEAGEYPPCLSCGSTEVISTLDWHEGSVIPSKPIRQDEIKETDHRGNKYFRLISVYDVSKKLKPDIKAVLKELVNCLYNGPRHVKPHSNATSFECIIHNDLLDKAKAIVGWDTTAEDEINFSDPVTIEEMKQSLREGHSNLPLILEVGGVRQKCMDYRLEKECLVLTDKLITEGENEQTN